MESSFYVYLSSQDSTNNFPDNSAFDFTLLLPERIFLEGDKWWCGLIQCHLTSAPKQDVFICTDICAESVTGSSRLPVLRRIRTKVFEASHVTYVPVKVRELSSIRVYIRDKRGNSLPFSAQTSSCVLHFQRK